MKIAYVLPDFDENACSGGLYVIFEHCNGLLGRGHSVRVFNGVGTKSKYLKLDCEVENHCQDPLAVESSSPDVIIGTHWRTYFFLQRLKRVIENKTRLFFLVQSNDKLLVSSEERALVDKALTGFYNETVPIHKIAVSSYLRNILNDEFGQSSFYVSNGLDMKEVKPMLGGSDKVRIAARYDPSQYRGWDTVNKVLARISKRDDVEIHLFEMKDKKPVPYNAVFHKGLTGGGLLSLFKSCDIYISGSTYEGFAYPILEAMSQGCAVCCTNAGGNMDFCINGETALVSRRGDEEGLFGNLKKTLEDKGLRDKLRTLGINKAKEFTWSRSIDEMESALGYASG